MIAQDTVRREMLWARDGEGTPAIPLLIHLLRYGYEHHTVVIPGMPILSASTR